MGAIYLTIQNLPRQECYKEENVILVGVIPGPKEPKLSMNAYLASLVKDLQTAWCDGISVPTPNGSHVSIRLALTCVSCDIPASRKVCGFLGHNATLGCSKCLKEFTVRSIGDVDYSGFDRTNWEPRTIGNHCSRCEELKSETTKTGMRKAESNLGVRYSVLLELLYFDVIRCTVVDIMHNLFLGTGKNTFKLWLSMHGVHRSTQTWKS